MNALPSQGLVKRLAGHPAEAGSSGSETDAPGVERAGWGRAAEGWELRRGRPPPSWEVAAAASPAAASCSRGCLPVIQLPSGSAAATATAGTAWKDPRRPRSVGSAAPTEWPPPASLEPRPGMTVARHSTDLSANTRPTVPPSTIAPTTTVEPGTTARTTTVRPTMTVEPSATAQPTTVPPSTTPAAGSPATAAACPVADVLAALGGGAFVDDDRNHQRAAARAGVEHLQPVQPVDQEAATPGPIGRPPGRQLAGRRSRAATLRDRADRAIGIAPPAATWGHRVFLVQLRHDAAELPPTGSAGRPALAQQHDLVLGGVQPPGSRPPCFGDGPVLRATSHPAGGSGLSWPRGPQRPGRDDRQAADTAVRVPPPRRRRGRGAPAADGQRRSWTPRCLRRRVARALLPGGGPLARLGLPVHRRAGAGRPPNDGAFQGRTGRRQTTQRPHRLGGQPPTRVWRVDRGCEPRHPSVRRAELVDTPTLIPPSAGRLARVLLTRPAAPPRSLGPLASLAPSRYREAERRARSSSASSWVRVGA
jgi:hypothetical protein